MALTIVKKSNQPDEKTEKSLQEIRSDYMARVLQAHASGKEIERRSLKGQDWVKVKNPDWDFKKFEYRVYKEPIIVSGKIKKTDTNLIIVSTDIFHRILQGYEYEIVVNFNKKEVSETNWL